MFKKKKDTVITITVTEEDVSINVNRYCPLGDLQLALLTLSEFISEELSNN